MDPDSPATARGFRSVPLSERDRAFTLVGILLALFLGAIDQTIVSTALPRIVEDLHGLSRYAWVATAYLLASTSLVPIYGKLADTYSRKRIQLMAVGLFLTGSFLCGLSGEFGSLPLLGDGMNQLIVFRGVQGLGGAGLFAMAFIIIADLFPPAERGKYQGFVGGVWGIASVLGPFLGGFLTDYASGIIPGVEGWRWVFYVNVPFGALALWFIITRMPPLRPGRERARLDYVSALWLVSSLVPFILALQLEKSRYPWIPRMGEVAAGMDAATAVRPGLFLVAALAMILFVRRSLRSRNPILDLALFRNRVFTTSNLATFFFGAAFMSVLLFLPLFLVNVVGVSATRAGIGLIPLSMGLVTGSVTSGQLVSRFGHYRRLILGGGLILMVGVLQLARMGPEVGYGTVLVYMVICGIGFGPSLPLYTLAVQNAVDVRKIGQATSASQFFRQIGGTTGAAIMGTVLAVGLASAFAGADLPDALAGQDFRTPQQRLSSTGNAHVAEDIRSELGSTLILTEQAVRQGDGEALQRVLQSRDTPDEAKALLRQITAAPLPADPNGQEAAVSRIRTTLERRADEVISSVQILVHRAFATVLTRIFGATLAIIVVAWIVTLFLPELPLRRTFDQDSVPANEPLSSPPGGAAL